ncbi:hypothetical protein [Oceanobacter mangrovi]|uniref:hypothetical protein n=1 Tax=Oceanobacter mangrovi TaxID=2862510 RepID=UPI001C8DD939|nr:hypothetical protein [Oceanobacter mangrovi]
MNNNFSVDGTVGAVAEIRRDPAVMRFLARMPDEIAASFSDDQLFHLRNAIGSRQWGKHALDWRGYFVILAGRNRR